jgi:hypothetical protein
MTQNTPPPDRELDQLLAELAATEREHRAPGRLQRNLMAQLGAEALNARGREHVGSGDWSTLLEQLGRWLQQHRLRASLLSATAAALPLTVGLLLAMQTRSAIDASDQSSEFDPTAQWVMDLEELGLQDLPEALDP